ncbi:MAG: hypothetical protein NTX53_01705 [candidate division WOR-3 bacterium]|nr:hypothetical protein [candidate division WOR-3 bacterium]
MTVWAESTTGNWQEAVALFNGGGGLEWERWSYLRSSALAMSPGGDYISFSSVDDYYPDLTKAESPKEGAMEQKPAPKGALPKARAMKKIPVPPDSCVSACCLLNRRGELVMKLSVPFVVDECVFSPDGQRLAFCCRDSRARAKPRQDGIVVVNIPTREELFRAALPRGEKEREVLLADDAAAVILTDKKLYWITAAGSILGNVDVSSGLPREEDKEGMHSLLQSIRFLGWSGDAPVLGLIQHLAGKVRV